MAKLSILEIEVGPWTLHTDSSLSFSFEANPALYWPSLMMHLEVKWLAHM